MPYVERPIEKPSDPSSLAAYALAYKEHLQTRGYATQSVQYKHAAITWFIDWCRERGIERIEQITRPTLQRYQRHLHYAISRSGKPLSVAGQRNRLTAVRTWFKYLMRENLILYNPASELELPKPEKRLPKHTLTPEEAEQVLSQPDIEGDPRSALLHRHPPPGGDQPDKPGHQRRGRRDRRATRQRKKGSLRAHR